MFFYEDITQLDSKKLAILCLVLIVVGVNLIIAISGLDFPKPTNPDPPRNYLVANNIIENGELVLASPGTSIYWLRNSPIYSYLLSGFLLAENDFFFLSLVNILLQVINIVLVFFLGRILFNARVGAIASTLFGLSWVVSRFFDHFWRAYMMQPVFTLSLLLLALAYVKESHPLLTVSVAVFAISGAVHISSFLMTPLFVFVSFILLVREGNAVKGGIKAAGTFLGTIFVLYMPMVFYLFSNELIGRQATTSSIFASSFSNFLENFIDNVYGFFDLFFIFNNETQIGYIFMGVCLALGIIYFIRQDNSDKRLLILGLTGFSLLYIAALSLLSVQIAIFYFAPVIPLFMIMLAELIDYPFSSNLFFVGIKVLLILGLVYLFSGHLKAFNTQGHMKDFQRVSLASESIAEDAKIYLDRVGSSEPDFFRVHFYHTISPGTYERGSAAAFWYFLSEFFPDHQFVANNSSRAGYDILSGMDVIYLVCYRHPEDYPFSECRDQFRKARREYKVEKTIYSEGKFEIYRTQKRGGRY